MDGNTSHILLVEDEDAHAELIRRAFEGRDGQVDLTVVGSLREARESLAASIPDLVIADIRLPDGDGIEMLPEDKEAVSYPVVMLTAHGDAQAAVAAVKRGALDYVVKSEATLAEVPHIVQRTLREWRHIARRKQAEEALRRSQERYALAVSAGRVGVWDWNLKTNELYVDPSLKALLGYEDHEIRNHLDEWNKRILPDDRDRLTAGVKAHLEGRQPRLEVEHRVLHGDGGIRWFLTQGTASRDAGGEPYRLLGTATDITERKRAEEALRASEEKFRRFFENEPEYCYMLSPEGVILDVNRAALKALGYRKRELVGKSSKMIYAPESLPKIKPLIAKCKKGGRLRDEELVLLTKEGEKRTVLLSAAAVKDEDGKVRRWVSVQRDITERKRAEEEKDKLLRAIETTKEAINIASADGKIIYTNDGMDGLFGYKKGELIGKCPPVLNAGPNPEAVTKQIVDAIEKDDCWEGEIHNKRKDGTEFTSYAIISALKDENGRILSFVSTQHDITERKRAEEALREGERLRAEAEKLAAIGRLAARVAQEINNPLAGVKNSFLLIKDAVPKDHPDYEFVGRIEKEINRIAQIVRQMFKLHSPNQGSVREICVAETIHDVLVMMEPSCREHRVRVEVHPADPRMTARIPEGTLWQVLYNLLANAIEASPPGGMVKITATMAEKMLQVTVSDQGAGIPAEARDRVFEPFFTTKGGATGGMGLGLSVSRGIVEAAGGDLDFQSTPGKGTVFQVVLPTQAT